MNQETLKKHRQWVQEELKASIDFWLKNGMDQEHGGVYTCLDRTGKLFSSDKSVWFQGRTAWTFCTLCRLYGVQKEWLEAAKSCLDFMEKFCINPDAERRMYFTVTADGKPLRQRRYCFSEGFYAIANAEYYALTGEAVYLERARMAYELIWNLNQGLIEDPAGLGPKTIPQTRTGRSLATPMIFLNTTAIMRRCDPEQTALYDERANICCDEILKYHFKPELHCTLENVGLNGELQTEYSAGRVVNPGHSIEGSWFLMEQAYYAKDEELRKKAQIIFDDAYEIGWDKEYGGLLYFVDCQGMPPEAYEHDMKLWWPHNELLIASLMIYRDTKDEKYWNIFEQTMDYCKTYFHDAEYPDWYGYLRRDGKPTLPACKGSTFKGPFHLPRCLMIVDQILSELIEQA